MLIKSLHKNVIPGKFEAKLKVINVTLKIEALNDLKMKHKSLKFNTTLRVNS